MSDKAESDGNGKVYINGKTLDFSTYVVMKLEALDSRTGRLEKAAIAVMSICCLSIIYAVFRLIGLPS